MFVGSFELDIVPFEFRWVEFDEFKLHYGPSTHFDDFSQDQSVLSKMLNTSPALLIHQCEVVRAIVCAPFVSLSRWHPEVLGELVPCRGGYHVIGTLGLGGCSLGSGLFSFCQSSSGCSTSDMQSSQRNWPSWDFSSSAQEPHLSQ